MGIPQSETNTSDEAKAKDPHSNVMMPRVIFEPILRILVKSTTNVKCIKK
jgi:hypothetical protein